MPFHSFEGIAEYLDGLGLFHMDLSLERVARFASTFGASDFLVAHVAGTNGKGSTSAFIERLAREHGVRTGLYASPHFLDLRERVLVGGAWLGEAEWVAAANEVDALAGDAGLTYFEFLTCLAMSAFRAAGVELAVMEAGLGGRWDAVRAFGSDVAALASIGLDHMQVLGPTLEDIAWDKAHVIRAKSRAFSAPQDERAAAVLRERAERVGADLVFTSPLAGKLGMRGPHQRVNAGLGLAVWEELARRMGIAPDHDACERAVQRAFVPGRFQVLEEGGCVWILDGAHNQPALEVLGATLSAERLAPSALVVSCMRDKDLEQMVPQLRALTSGPVFCPLIPQHERMLPGAKLAALLGRDAVAMPDSRTAFDQAAGTGGPVLVCGSLYLLAEFYRFFPRHLKREVD
ncbi:MAG: folylpolyglutamate synthase/dihydrofolate synthase family protein [Desulfovibrio sp.]